MKIGNHEIKLFYSNIAVREINKLCGGVGNISRLFTQENGDPVPYDTEVTNMIKLICILANAEITKENCEKRLGLIEGEEKPHYKFEDLEQLIDISRIREYMDEIIEVMNKASKFEVPDGVKLKSGDIDLAEIEAEKNP